jgi:hypothetical protein
MYADPGRIQPDSACFSRLRSGSISPYCPPNVHGPRRLGARVALPSKMLSGWQTVAVSLGASGITALAAFLVAEVTGRHGRAELDSRLEHERAQQERQLEHERAEQWRDRLVRAADDFSTGAGAASATRRSPGASGGQWSTR